MKKDTIVYNATLKDVTKEHYEDVVDYFDKAFGVDIEEILKEYRILTFSIFYNLFDESLYEGMCDFNGKNVLLGFNSISDIYDVDLGIIIHELTHVVQYATWFKKYSLYAIFRNVMLVLTKLLSREAYCRVYYNDKIEVQARASVYRFELIYGYKNLKGK